MNKVICDICGTAYPETAPKCPICGYAKTSSEPTAAGTSRDSAEGGSSYSAVKGGRFSKQNVRKRASGKASERGSTASEKSRRAQKEESGNTGLVLVVIFLLVAIVAVVIYIGLRVFRSPEPDTGLPSGSSQVTQPTETTPNDSTDATEGEKIACESLQLSNQTIEFVNAGDTWTIQVRPTPSNTTNTIKFKSSDRKVVTVDKNGLLTAVGPGDATITVTCGKVKQTCKVKCSFVAPTEPTTDPSTDPSAPTNPTAPTTQATTKPTAPAGPVDPNFTFAFNTKWQDENSGKWDTSILKQGETWRAYKKNLSVDPSAITWTSDDPAVCTVENGVVTAIAPGKTEIHAQYGGKTYTCIVRCKFEASSTDATVAPTEPATQPTTGTTVAPTEPATQPATGTATVAPTEPATQPATGTATVAPTEPATVTPTKPVDPNFTFAFNTKFNDATTGKWDTTLQKLGETWRAYEKDMKVDPSDITWTTDDSSVCTIKDGVVTAVGSGKTEIHAQYGGKTYTCIVRVKD